MTTDHDEWDMIKHERSTEDRLQKEGPRNVKEYEIVEREIGKHESS